MATQSNKLNVEVRGRQGVVFLGDLTAVTGFNTVGVFDVLPDHANFISMITKKVILHKEDGKIDEINLDNGVIVVEDNKVQIFLGVSKM